MLDIISDIDDNESDCVFACCLSISLSLSLIPSRVGGMSWPQSTPERTTCVEGRMKLVEVHACMRKGQRVLDIVTRHCYCHSVDIIRSVVSK